MAEKETSMPEATSMPRRVDGEDLTLALVTYVSAMVIFLSLATLLAPDDFASPVRVLFFLAANSLAALTAVSACLIAPARATLASLGLSRISARWLVLGVLGGLIVPLSAFVLLVASYVAFVSISGEEPPGRGATEPLQTVSEDIVSGIILLSFICVVAPIAEELLFRGVLYGYLRRWGKLLALAVSSLAFGIAHGGFLPIYVVAGIILALLYERSGSLWPAIAAHATNNTLIMGSLVIPQLL